MKSNMDGINHINVYSKGKTPLGRFLSNFTKCELNTEDGRFNSIEGYWYWLGCQNRFGSDKLRDLCGFEAKRMGRHLGAADWLPEGIFRQKIKKAIKNKIMWSDYWIDFINSTLPFTHYYEYGDKVIQVPSSKWIIEYLEELRSQYAVR